MRIKISTICFSFVFAIIFATAAFAQGVIDASTPNGKVRREELPQNIKETMEKQRIEREKKNYEELLEKSQEAVKLSEELEKSFALSNQLSAEDRKKLDRLEKLVKKIRAELGGDDEGELEVELDKENSSNIAGAFQILQKNAAQLFSEIKKSTRYSVSVVAIRTSNVLLKLVKFIRFGK